MKKSFRDPTTNALKAYGYMLSNAPGDIARDEPDDFSLESGKWKLEGDQWVPVPLNNNAEIQAQMDAIERATLMNRGSREGWITLILKEAAEIGKTEADLLDPVTGNHFFMRLREVDNQIRALRSQMS